MFNRKGLVSRPFSSYPNKRELIMLNLDQCLGANRPLIFAIGESDIEILQHLRDKHKKNSFFVYSTSMARVVPLDTLFDQHFFIRDSQRSISTVEALDSILTKEFKISNNKFSTYIFLDSDSYIGDKQIVRKIKDIVSRYQLEESFTVNMIFISQAIAVPMGLERISEVVFFDLPSEAQLKEFSDGLVKKLELKGDRVPSAEVVNNLKGLTHFETEQAYLQSFFIHKKIDLPFIMDFKKSALAKTDLLGLLDSNVTFDDIGGLSHLKDWVKESCGGWTVEGKKFGLPLLKGLLLVGLSGCGKSLLCKAMGNEWGLPVVAFDPSRVFSSRVGDSETNMRRVLKIVEGIAPCVLMVDEIEKGFAGFQSSTFSDAGVTARVIGSFLIWLQDCTKPVFTVATSNNIQYLPPELISRFDETFFVNIPQFKERRDIFKIHIAKLGRDPSKHNLDILANNSVNFSGREIEQVLKKAMYRSFHSKKDLTDAVILEVMEKKTTVLTTMAEQLKYLLEWVGWDDAKGDGIRARFASPLDDNSMERVKKEIDDIIGSLGKDGDKK